ncbi:MAG: methyltransferase family protein [Myxococcota bacterium]
MPWPDDATYFRLRGWIPIPLYLGILAFLEPGPPASLEWIGGLGGLAIGLWLRARARLVMGRSSDTRRLHAKRLVTDGPYRFVRNPIYLGNWAMAMGAALLAGAWVYAPVLGGLLALHYLRVIRAEERNLEQTFPDEYPDYRRRVPRLVPRLAPEGWRRALQPLQREVRIVAWATLAAALLILLRIALA